MDEALNLHNIIEQPNVTVAKNNFLSIKLTLGKITYLSKLPMYKVCYHKIWKIFIAIKSIINLTISKHKLKNIT